MFLKILKIEVKSEERDDPLKLANTHSESLKYASLPFDRAIRQGDWGHRQMWKAFPSDG